MKTTGRSAALVLVVAALAACTGGGGGGGGSPKPSGPPVTSSTTVSVSPNPAVYLYENAGLVATVDLDAHTMVVQNGTGQELGAPGFYVLAADDGHQVDGKVVDAAPVPDGRTVTFGIALTGIDRSNIGLMLLVVGDTNDGAFVRQ